MMAAVKTVILTLTLAHLIFCQENAGTNLAPALEECYNNTRYLTRDYRLPADISVLVELIRRIEDQNPSQDARELSFELLHRFRQDGIRRTAKDIDSSQGLPFSPKGWESYKNRLQLKKLTPGNAVNFNNDSLTHLQSCSLHFMVSSTVEIHQRGDEGTVCNRIAHYTARLNKREIEIAEPNTFSFSKSSCPIESGVVYTKWGTIKAGLLLSGIASGFQPMSIRTSNGTVETPYGSTIAGELSEVALNQPNSNKVVGNSGGWNNTVDPKYYFLQNAEIEHLYLTDAEIRGGLDGLYLALNLQNWKSRSNNIQISQMLDLYYGRGIFNDSSRACNRKNLLKEYIEGEKLVQQTYVFNELLDPVSQYGYTPNKANFLSMAKAAVDSLRTYINGNLNDLGCSAENDIIERVSTDVLIFIDVSWDNRIIQPFVSYILKNIDINKYESSYTILDGVDGNIIVNKSRSILDFYENFNLTVQQKYPTGFNYRRVIEKAEALFKAKLNNDTDLTTAQSTIVLMLPRNSPQSSDNEFISNKKDFFKSYLPDLRIIVAGSGSKSAYNDLVLNANNDIFVISESSDDTSIRQTAGSIVERFQKIPRSIVNPSCGSTFVTEGASSYEVFQYVEPLGVNYHRISPNYFYDGQTLKIRGQGYGSVTVCISRTDTNPRANTTGINCNNLVSEEMSVDISTYCADETVTDCSAIYISVQGITSQIRCNEKTCRFPDSIKYSIYLENVHCSSSERLLSSLALVCLLFAIMRF